MKGPMSNGHVYHIEMDDNWTRRWFLSKTTDKINDLQSVNEEKRYQFDNLDGYVQKWEA